MPVEIRELVIRAVTTLDAPESDSESKASSQALGSSDEQTAIVEECVRQVMKILQKTKGR